MRKLVALALSSAITAAMLAVPTAANARDHHRGDRHLHHAALQRRPSPKEHRERGRAERDDHGPYGEAVHVRVSDQRPALVREDSPDLVRNAARRSVACRGRATRGARGPRE